MDQKYFEKNFLLNFILKYRSPRSHTKIFKQNFYQFGAVFLGRIWTDKSTEEKAHYFS